MSALWVSAFLAGAGAGALLRVIASRRVQWAISGNFPWGTLVVNLTGCFLLGLAGGPGVGPGESAAAVALGTGLIGSYTTFATFSAETVNLVAAGLVDRAALNVAANLVVGLAAAAAGLGLASVAGL